MRLRVERLPAMSLRVERLSAMSLRVERQARAPARSPQLATSKPSAGTNPSRVADFLSVEGFVPLQREELFNGCPARISVKGLLHI